MTALKSINSYEQSYRAIEVIRRNLFGWSLFLHLKTPTIILTFTNITSLLSTLLTPPPSQFHLPSMSFQLHMSAGAAPCLMLHNDDDLNDVAKIPQHVALPVNIRKVDTLTLGENCVERDDILVNKLRKDKKDPSILTNGGQYCFIFTSYNCYENSYDENPTPSTNTVMHSTSTEEVSHFHATELTKEIIIQGIKWLKGNAYANEDLGSVPDALQEYLNALEEMIPLQNPSELSLDNAHDFIKGRKWSSDSQYDMNLVLDHINGYPEEKGKSELVMACCLVRRFIYKHMARQTKVVAHVVDGIHRVTALECALMGYKPPDTDDYALCLPHAATNLAITSTVPVVSHLESENFLDDMKRMSSECQQSFGSLQPHSKKEFFAAMIKHLDEEIHTKRFHVRPFFFDGHEVQTEYVAIYIKSWASKIIKVIKKHVEYYRMVPKMELTSLLEKDDESWKNLFKNNKGQFSFLWDDGKLTVVKCIHNHSDIFNINRYARDGFNSEVFELAQVLLWSRISQDTYNQLINCFTTNTVSSSVTQVSASDKNGIMRDQWVSGIVDTVGTSVYYSYKVVSKGKNHSTHVQPRAHYFKQSAAVARRERLLLELIASAIKGTTEFFCEYGLHPSPPDWFKEVQEKFVDPNLIMRAIDEVGLTKGAADKDLDAIYKYFEKTLNLPDNFVAFIRTAFAIYVESRVLNRNIGRPTLRDDLDESLKQNQTIICKKDTKEKWTACIKEYASQFAKDEFSGERLKDNILLMTRHFIGSRKFHQVWKSKKYNKIVEAEIITPNDYGHQVMNELMRMLRSLQESDLPNYIQNKIINNSLDENTKEKAQKLLALFDELCIDGSDDSEGNDGESQQEDMF